MAISHSAAKAGALAALIALVMSLVLFMGFASTDTSAEYESCLTGVLVKRLFISSPEAVKPEGTALEVIVMLNITYLPDGREFLVQLTAKLIPANGSEASIYYTPPLLDMIVYSDTGKHVWSSGKAFIQAILQRKLPLSESISMKVRADCIYRVEALVVPLKLHVPFGEAVGSPGTSTAAENYYYVVYGIFSPPVKHGSITISRVSLVVEASKEVPISEVETEVKDLLTAYLGNVNGTVEVHAVPLAPSKVSAMGESVTITKVTPTVTPYYQVPATTSTGTYEIVATTTVTPSRTTTSELTVSTLAKSFESLQQRTTSPTTTTVSAVLHRGQYEKWYLPREYSVTIAVAIALVAGLIAYLAIIRPLR